MGEKGVWIKVDGVNYKLNQLLFADDSVDGGFGRGVTDACEHAWSGLQNEGKIKVNIMKSKVMCCNLIGRRGISVRWNGELLEEVDYFRCSGTEVTANGRMVNKLTNRLREEIKVFGDLKKHTEREC